MPESDQGSEFYARYATNGHHFHSEDDVAPTLMLFMRNLQPLLSPESENSFLFTPSLSYAAEPIPSGSLAGVLPGELAHPAR